MNKTTEALKMAIEAMENCYAICDSMHHSKKDRHEYDEKCPVIHRWNDTLNACKEALESQDIKQLNDEYLRDTHVDGLSQQQEPLTRDWIGTALERADKDEAFRKGLIGELTQSLSDDELGKIVSRYEYSVHPDLDGFARAIEQAHGIGGE